MFFSETNKGKIEKHFYLFFLNFLNIQHTQQVFCKKKFSQKMIPRLQKPHSCLFVRDTSGY